MRTNGTLFRLGQDLALLATLFGGLFLGAGNMLSVYLDPAMAQVLHGQHAMGRSAHEQAHGQHAAHANDTRWLDPALVAMSCGDGLQGALASPLAHGDHPDHARQPDDVQVLPAHCLFCLDGIAPQPVDLLGSCTSDAIRLPLPAAATAESTLLAQRYRAAHPRAPPKLLA